jgi:hypothetical protein
MLSISNTEYKLQQPEQTPVLNFSADTYHLPSLFNHNHRVLVEGRNEESVNCLFIFVD